MFISCGDVLVDLFSQPVGKSGEVGLKGHVGGSPFNVAVGLSRLGNSAGFLCKNSTDFIGQSIAQYMEANNIRMDWVQATSRNSTLAMIQKNSDGSANYAFYINDTADVSLTTEELPDRFPDELIALHFGSYSTAVEPAGSALLSLAQRESSRRVISYDPNLRPTIQPDLDIWRERFARFCQSVDFLKASDEDVEMLYGKQKSFDAFAADAIAVGAKAVAVTEGGSGATVYTADGRSTRSRPISIEVVDTVGAGDTFQAASLHWLNANGCMSQGALSVDGIDIDDWVNFAAGAAAITCTRHGADLPTLDAVTQWLSTRG